MKQHQASDGSIWHVECICPPVPSRAFDWAATHEDCEGEPGGTVYASTEAALADAIEEWIEENEPEPIDPEGDRGPNYLPDPDLDGRCKVHGGAGWVGGYCDRWATDTGKGPCVR